MKSNISLPGVTRWMSLIFLVCLICACGTQDIKVEGADEAQDTSEALIQTPLSEEGTDTTHPTPTPPSLQTNTPSLESEPINIQSPIPHFSPGEPITITHIDMFDATSGWAIGRDEETSTDHILTTSDGGSTWRDVTPPVSPLEEMNDFIYRQATGFFFDEQRASVIYDPESFGDPARIWNTTSAGNQWEVITIETNFQVVEDLTFADESHGWLMLGVEAGMGHSWVELYQINIERQQWDLLIDPYRDDIANLHYCCKNGMVFFNSDTGLLTFGRGPMGGAFIDWTNSGGLNWETHPLPRPEGHFEEIGDPDYGILCESHSPTLFSPQSGKVSLECWTDLDASDIVSFIFTTQDGGISWESETYPGGQMLFLNPDVGWALSDDIFQTLDGGQTWAKMSTVQWEGQFSFVSQRQGWAAVWNGEEYALVYTEDGGKTWELIEPIIVE